MLEDMQIRNLSPHTIDGSLRYVAQFATLFKTSPDRLGHASGPWRGTPVVTKAKARAALHTIANSPVFMRSRTSDRSRAMRLIIMPDGIRQMLRIRYTLLTYLRWHNDGMSGPLKLGD